MRALATVIQEAGVGVIARNVGKILRGTTASQVVGLLFLPFISRLYSPDDFGRFGVVLVVVTVLAIGATLQLQHAIVIVPRRSRGLDLFALTCLAAGIGGGVAAIASLLYHMLTNVAAGALSFLIGLAVFASAIGQAAQGLAIRTQRFARIGIVAVVRTVVVGALQIVLGIGGLGIFGLLVGFVIGELLAAIILLGPMLIEAWGAFNRLHPIRTAGLLRRYRDFATYGTAHELLNSASQGIPIILFGAFYGAPIAGIYAFAIRVLLGPIQAVSNAFRQVLLERFSRLSATPDTLIHEFRLISIASAVVVLLIAIIASPWLPSVFVLLFGEGWQDSGEFGRWLVFWVVFGICNVPSTVIMRVINRQREGFIANAAIFVARAMCLVVGGLVMSPMVTVIAFSMLGVVSNLAVMGLGWHYIKAWQLARA